MGTAPAGHWPLDNDGPEEEEPSDDISPSPLSRSAQTPGSSDSPLFGNVLENSSILHRAVGHNTAHHGAASFMIRLVVIIRKYSQVMTVS